MQTLLALVGGTLIASNMPALPTIAEPHCPDTEQTTESSAQNAPGHESGSAVAPGRENDHLVRPASYVQDENGDAEEEDAEAEYVTPDEPGLAVGDKAPELELLDEEGNTVNLADLYADGPVVINFYRGGWCPYCNRALSKWQEKVEELKAAGGTLVALTGQKPTYIEKTKQSKELEYVVLSDTDGDAARAFMVQFTLDDKTIEKYKGYGIDLPSMNSEGKWTLPAPATFVIDTEGVIKWVWADWDYSKRADPDDVIEAVREITGE